MFNEQLIIVSDFWRFAVKATEIVAVIKKKKQLNFPIVSFDT